MTGLKFLRATTSHEAVAAKQGNIVRSDKFWREDIISCLPRQFGSYKRA